MSTPELRQRTLDANGIRLHITEAGSGPLVLFCHGWPELGYTWRHQLAALASAGFHAVAPDMRGYGQSDAPDDITRYSVFDLVGDMVGIVAALGERNAIIVGHDWGAPVAWHAALFRPDVFRAVAALSVPHRGRSATEPLETLRKAGMSNYYWIYFQEPGVAEAEFERDLDHTFRKLFYGLPGPNAPKEPLTVPEGGGFLDRLVLPDVVPDWLTPEVLTTFVSGYRRNGFRGGLNWYRNITRNWESTAPWEGALITRPALFLTGTRDPVTAGARGAAAIEHMKQLVPGVKVQLLEGAGHWVQQERPDEVNAALIDFVRSC